MTGFWCTEHIRSEKMGTSDTSRGYYIVLVYNTYRLKGRPLFNGSNASHFFTARFFINK